MYFPAAVNTCEDSGASVRRNRYDQPPIGDELWIASLNESSDGCGASLIERMAGRADRTSRRAIVAGLGLLFVASRIGFHLAGVRFDDGSLQWFYQILDPVLLRENLVESVFYQHSQPPAFNIFLGITLKLFGDSAHAAFAVLYGVMAFAVCLGTLTLLRGVGVRRLIALPLVCLMMICPSLVIYENWLFYDLPVLAMLVVAAVGLQQWSADSRCQWLVVFAIALAALCLTRSFFHLGYQVMIGVCLTAAAVGRRRRVGLAIVVAIALTSTLYVKNQMVFGKFAGSTWLGMTLAEMTTYGLSETDRRKLVDGGVISQLSMHWPFEPLEEFPPAYRSTQGFDGIAVLTEPYKSTGKPNYNHIAYIRIADQYTEDSLSLVRHRPQAYLTALVKAWYHYFRPASRENLVGENRAALGWYDRAWNAMCYGRVPLPWRINRKQAEVFVLLALGLLIGCAMAVAVAVSPSARAASLTPTSRLVFWFMFFTVVYVTTVGTLLESGENFRFRFYVGPFILCFFAMAPEALLRRRYGPVGPISDQSAGAK